MANEIEKKYKLYERLANSNPKDMHKKIYICYGIIGVLVGVMISMGSPAAVLPFAVGIGAVLGVVAGHILIRIGEKKHEKLCNLENSEGYSDAMLAETYNILNKSKSFEMKRLYSSIVAMVHNFRGEFSKALDVLSGVDETLFTSDPSTADLYYSQKMLAYLCLGDLDHSADAYNRGLYFMRTYMNNPSRGMEITLSLSVYEFYCGHYDISLQLLEKALADNRAKPQGEIRIPAEQMTTMLCYWKAMNLASMGNKAAAWDSINYCKDFYKTPYYQQCCEKLLADMEKNHKSEMI